jgi:hypothetical protein
MISTTSMAVTYSTDNLSQFKSNQEQEELTKEFVRGFFIAKDPIDYINEYISIYNDKQNPLYLESRLYRLLSEISFQPKQKFLQTFVDKMKTYQTQAFKMHDEGRLPVAIFNLNSKAQGIENIWLATDSLNYYRQALSNNPLMVFEQLRGKLYSLKQPQWLGLKNSILELSAKNQVLIADYFLQDKQSIIGLDKFVSHFVLLTADEELLEYSLQILDKSNSEYVLRQMINYFPDEFVSQQLIKSVDNNKNQTFAISMMTNFIESPLIQEKLLSYLVNEKLSNAAALVLTNTQNLETIIQIDDLYYKSNSSHVKKQILFTMRMNKLEQSNVLLKQMTQQIDENSESSQWLKSMNGELK